MAFMHDRSRTGKCLHNMSPRTVIHVDGRGRSGNGFRVIHIQDRRAVHTSDLPAVEDEVFDDGFIGLGISGNQRSAFIQRDGTGDRRGGHVVSNDERSAVDLNFVEIDLRDDTRTVDGKFFEVHRIRGNFGHRSLFGTTFEVNGSRAGLRRVDDEFRPGDLPLHMDIFGTFLHERTAVGDNGLIHAELAVIIAVESKRTAFIQDETAHERWDRVGVGVGESLDVSDCADIIAEISRRGPVADLKFSSGHGINAARGVLTSDRPCTGPDFFCVDHRINAVVTVIKQFSCKRTGHIRTADLKVGICDLLPRRGGTNTEFRTFVRVFQHTDLEDVHLYLYRS